MKSKTIFECSKCGAQYPKWVGQCSSCGAWGTVEQNETIASPRKYLKIANPPRVLTLAEIADESGARMKTGIGEFDRALGGGLIPGAVTLIGGDPGVGKSTLMLQALKGLIRYNPLYITGEESLAQIKTRASRLDGIPGNLKIIAETSIERAEAAILSENSGVVAVDSIQSVFSERIDGVPGALAQIRESTQRLISIAKSSGKAIFIIGHVTKEGYIAGPKALEHMVDTVLQFEGEKTYSYRILRALKNRFGRAGEIGVFEMSDKGLREVENPSAAFLSERDFEGSGVAVVAAMEGGRPILLEAQALVAPTSYSAPQRTCSGFDLRRLQIIIAVLEKRLGASLGKMDVFVNIAGGIYVNDPAIDLGIAAAIASSLKDEAIGGDAVFIGEIGLTGEVRGVSNIERRIAEADKLGLQRAIVPASAAGSLVRKFNIKLIPAKRISLAFSNVF